MSDVIDPESADSCSLTEEEVEPKLKYVRLSNDLKNILSEEAVSCITVHPRFLCLGTHWGRIHMLDHQGNRVETLINLKQNPHILSVNKIAVDSKGEHIATCSDDGMIIISGLYTDENNQKLNVGKVIKSVELDPMHYKSGSGRRFLIGDNKLVLYEKTFLKGLKSTILSESEGQVSAIKWNGQFIAWASSLGVHVYDLNERCSLGLIKWEEPKERKLTDFRCNLSWSNSTTLLIGWVDTIRICVIRRRNPIEVSTRNLPSYIVDPMSTFQTDFYVCGVAPLETHQLVVLGYSKDRDSETNKALRPILCVLQYKASDYIEICTDSLSMRGYQEYKCDDYHLDCLIDENQYFIVSPKDVVVASLYETDDRVQWLIEHGCLQWVKFCHCPETSERFASGGPLALQKFVICSEHFEASDVQETTRGLPLPWEAVPMNVGRTYMTPDMLIERGFNVEVLVKQENSEQNEQFFGFAHIPDEVMVEMLDPDEIKQELMDTQIKEEPMEENPLEIKEMEPKNGSKPTAKSIVPPTPQSQVICKGKCVAASNFRERYDSEIEKNERLEKSTKALKKEFADKVGRMQRIEDLLEQKKQKRDQLKEKYQELKLQYKKGILLTSAPQNEKDSNDDDDADFDEATAWW